jgi:Aldolase/RraA
MVGVKALGSNPKKSAKAGVGKVNVDVVIDGVTLRPEVMVWCTPDGMMSKPLVCGVGGLPSMPGQSTNRCRIGAMDSWLAIVLSS